jgi:hypothetical protein
MRFVRSVISNVGEKSAGRSLRSIGTTSVLVLVTACGGDEITIHGSLAEGADADHVWIVGGSESAAIEADSFRITGIDGDLVDIRFTSDDGEEARMELRDVAGGTVVRLRDVWFDDGMAFPSTIETDGADRVLVNGIRMADISGLAGEASMEGTVIAASRSGDAIILRSRDSGQADVRVVVTPGTLVLSPDGEPADLEDVDDGDELSVRGTWESGYLIAAEIIAARPE